MPRSILVVDDSATVRQQLATVLEAQGFEVFQADSGLAGVEQARARAFDLIITDVNMPGGDGLRMLSQIREIPAHASTPVFVLTTESSKAMINRGKGSGATAWIVKPFSAEALKKGIAKILGT